MLRKGGGNVYSSENEWKEYIVSIDNKQYIIDKIALEDANSKYKSITDITKHLKTDKQVIIDNFILTDYLTLDPIEASHAICISLHDYMLLDPTKHKKVSYDIYDDIHVFSSNKFHANQYNIFDIKSLYSMLNKEYQQNKSFTYKIHNKNDYVEVNYIVYESNYYDLSLYWKVENIYKNIYKKVITEDLQLKVNKNVTIYYNKQNQYICFNDDITANDILLYRSSYSFFHKNYLKNHLYSKLDIKLVDFLHVQGYLHQINIINKVHHFYHEMIGYYILFEDDLNMNDIIVYQNKKYNLKNHYKRNTIYDSISIANENIHDASLQLITDYKQIKLNTMKPLTKSISDLKSLPPRKTKKNVSLSLPISPRMILSRSLSNVDIIPKQTSSIRLKFTQKGGSEYIYFLDKNGKKRSKKIYVINGKNKVRYAKTKNGKVHYVSVKTFLAKIES